MTSWGRQGVPPRTGSALSKGVHPSSSASMLAYENKMVLWAVSPQITLKPSPPARRLNMTLYLEIWPLQR